MSFFVRHPLIISHLFGEGFSRVTPGGKKFSVGPAIRNAKQHVRITNNIFQKLAVALRRSYEKERVK